MRDYSPLSEWEYFHQLESYLADALQALVGEGSSLAICPRELVKHVGKNFDKIFTPERQRELSFDSAAFYSINQVLNAKHHRQERQWKVVDKAVVQALCVLKDLGFTDIAQGMEASWLLVDKSALAFSHQNHLLLAKVSEIPPFPLSSGTEAPKKGVQVSISVPDALSTDDFLEYLNEDIQFTSDVSQKGTILLTLASEKDVESIPEFYQKHKISVRIVQNFALTLHSLPDTKSGESVRIALKAVPIVPVRVHEPNREKKTIVVDFASKEDSDYIREHGVHMKPQKLTVLENETSAYVVYLETPASSQDDFKAIWRNHFGFLPESC